MSGMMADRHADDMKGLLKGLRKCSQYKQIILYPTERFMLPPENLEELLPLADYDAALLEDARKHPEHLKKKILSESTPQALSLFYEALFSFANGRHVILICDQGNELSRALLPFYSPATEKELDSQRIEHDKIPLLSGVKDWPFVFERFDSPLCLARLLPSEEGDMDFPWGTKISGDRLMKRKEHLLTKECPVEFPAEDVLFHPRALLIKGDRDGFLLAMPRPSNMKNLSITLRTGKGLGKEEEPAEVQSNGKAPSIERNWMSRAEVAEAIGKSKDTVDNYVRDGKLEANKVGREVRITKESVQRYLDGQ